MKSNLFYWFEEQLLHVVDGILPCTHFVEWPLKIEQLEHLLTSYLVPLFFKFIAFNLRWLSQLGGLQTISNHEVPGVRACNTLGK